MENAPSPHHFKLSSIFHVFKQTSSTIFAETYYYCRRTFRPHAQRRMNQPTQSSTRNLLNSSNERLHIGDWIFKSFDVNKIDINDFDARQFDQSEYCRVDLEIQLSTKTEHTFEMAFGIYFKIKCKPQVNGKLTLTYIKMIDPHAALLIEFYHFRTFYSESWKKVNIKICCRCALKQGNITKFEKHCALYTSISYQMHANFS